uniref:Uncharacterized protein n=1 Tax=viral metagenome TaxID=1070528 RepID=A0A6C0B0K0_9ZZZZ
MFTLCPPAIIYIIFSSIQIIIDLFKGLYNTAFMKFSIAILITLLLNGLCEQGLGVISWIIVFVPFILMTFVTAMLLYIFGMDAAKGASSNINNITNDSIYIIKTPEIKTTSKSVTVTKTTVPTYSSSPAYESFIN